MDDTNKETVYNFVSNFASKIFGNRSINKWLSKRKGENFLDMITTSNIAYTAAIVENNYEYWDQCLVLKNMTLIERKTYMESEGYVKKKSKFTQRVGRQRQYCGTGWSAEGVKLYQDVWKKWKTISHVNKFIVWKKLEERWEELAKENKFGCIAYTCAKIPSHNDNNKTTERDNQERCLPANRFSLDGEEHFESDKSWMK